MCFTNSIVMLVRLKRKKNNNNVIKSKKKHYNRVHITDYKSYQFLKTILLKSTFKRLELRQTEHKNVSAENKSKQTDKQ